VSVPVLAQSGGSYASPLGFLVFAFIAIATVLLIRNMNRRLRRLPPSFPDRQDHPDGEEQAPPR
jgi:hypothetical protein